MDENFIIALIFAIPVGVVVYLIHRAAGNRTGLGGDAGGLIDNPGSGDAGGDGGD